MYSYDEEEALGGAKENKQSIASHHISRVCTGTKVLGKII
jgi:hypothetical protein